MSNEDDGRHPDIIWLQPWCDTCETHCRGGYDQRLWCIDNVWEPCDECGNVAVKYTIVKDEPATDSAAPEQSAAKTVT